MSLYLGIDTSNYTTSIALCGDETVNLRKIIEIEEGQRGIRQSDGVFVHIKELPNLFSKLDIDMKRIKAVGVSTKPRCQENSYMPVFVAGESFAKVIAKTLDVPLYNFSHQDGHIMAGIKSSNAYELLEDNFYAVHLSGGTTEIVKCKFAGKSFNPQIVGGTKDISAGQLIDRIGVKMGIKFPCGKEIDRISRETDKILKLNVSVADGYMNMSGIETKLLNLTETENNAVIARSALCFIADSLNKALSQIKPSKVLFVGGVASNSILREKLSQNMAYKTYFASTELSSDNAVGIAELTKLCYGR